MDGYLLPQVVKVNGSPLLTALFRYKAWTNDEILTAMRLLDEKAQATERRTAIRIPNHTHVVDRIFLANLQGLRHEYTNTTDTPTLHQLDAQIRKNDH